MRKWQFVLNILFFVLILQTCVFADATFRKRKTDIDQNLLPVSPASESYDRLAQHDMRLKELERTIDDLQRKIDRLDERFEKLDRDLKELNRKV